MAATKKSFSEKSERPKTLVERMREDCIGGNALETEALVHVVETLDSIDASLKDIVAVIPKPQVTIPGLVLGRDGDHTKPGHGA